MEKFKADKTTIMDFQGRTRLFGHHNNKVNKAIDMVTEVTTKRVWYEVILNHETIRFVPNLDEAIIIFNKI